MNISRKKNLQGAGIGGIFPKPQPSKLNIWPEGLVYKEDSGHLPALKEMEKLSAMAVQNLCPNSSTSEECDHERQKKGNEDFRGQRGSGLQIPEDKDDPFSEVTIFDWQLSKDSNDNSSDSDSSSSSDDIADNEDRSRLSLEEKKEESKRLTLEEKKEKYKDLFKFM